MNKNILFVHGAWASKTCFNYMTKHALDFGNVAKIDYFEYDCQTESSTDILSRAHDQYNTLQSNQLPTIVIGHSLGGIIGLYLARWDNVDRIITLAAPLSGITSLNIFMHYYLAATAPIFNCLLPRSPFIKNLHHQDYSNKKIDILVATSGFNIAMPNKPSDGTISVETQIAWTPPGATVQMVKSNHHEILQAGEAIRTLELGLSAE